MIPEPTLKQQTIYQQDGPVRKQVDNSYSKLKMILLEILLNKLLLFKSYQWIS